MALQDRPYYRQTPGYGGGGFGGGGMRLAFPRLTPAVKVLLIINVVVFILQNIFRSTALMERMFACLSFEPWQVWRLITFQFLHGGVWHILFNMLGLYFLGTILERSWGAKRFLIFYLTCGAVGGLVYILGTAVGLLAQGVLIGASGGVLGLLVACAVLFPSIQVILFIFPVPIRFAAGLFTVVYILSVLSRSGNAGGNLCHLGGMATGFIWVMAGPYWQQWRNKYNQGAFAKRKQQEQALQYEVDQILAKVREQGIGSLTGKEKETLRKATEQQKKRYGQ